MSWRICCSVQATRVETDLRDCGAKPLYPGKFKDLRAIALPRCLAYIPRRSLPLPAFFSALASRVIEDPFIGQLLKNPTRPRTLGLGSQSRCVSGMTRVAGVEPVCNQASCDDGQRPRALGAFFRERLYFYVKNLRW